MASVPLAARLVEVIADRGASAAKRYRYGSGCIVRGRTVLTAAHVVAGAATVTVQDPHKAVYSATVDPRFVGDVDGPGPDLVLVEIDDRTLDVPPMGLARVDREGPTEAPVERCHAVGYPWFAETRSPSVVRDTVDAIRVVPVLSKLAAGLLSVQVSIAPRPLAANAADTGGRRADRDKVDPLAIVGHGWDALPSWAVDMGIEDFYGTDSSYFARLGVEVAPPISFEEVITWMSRAVFNPVVYRPLFEHLKFVTCRTFETPAAGTIPLFVLDPSYVRELYGESAEELVLPVDRAEDKLLDVIERPEHYAVVVAGIRDGLAARHSYAVRLQQLVEIVEA